MVQRESDNNVDVLVRQGVECAAPILAGADDIAAAQRSKLVRDERLAQARLAADTGDVVLTVAEGKQDG